jgi:ATP-dependent Lhr-like helicase
LAPFLAPTRAWFARAFGMPTVAQSLGWPTIAAGKHVLVVSPTGSGKTLTAFLWALDNLWRELLRGSGTDGNAERVTSDHRPVAAPKVAVNGARTSRRRRPTPDDPPAGVRILYVSPLKALNHDVARNLEVPLVGIAREAQAMGNAFPEIEVGVRTGDTPSADRARHARRPPHVMITTPESLYLLLTSASASRMFATTRAVIVDEIHTLVGTKRGAHLAVSLERLEAFATTPPQRIGLSATVRPLEEAARFLGGIEPGTGATPRPVAVVDAIAAGARKVLDLRICTVVDDFRAIPIAEVWSRVTAQVADLVDGATSTLVFCNTRRLAERTADRLNDHWAGSSAPSGPDDGWMFGRGADLGRVREAGREPVRAHHGSMSRAARLSMEVALKAGRLPALVATSSLELGIDIGDVDQVIQLEAPKSVSSGLQRAGRSGHQVGQIAKARMFPVTPSQVLEAAAVADAMLAGAIEPVATPENPLDVLAQQLVAIVAGSPDHAWTDVSLQALARRAWPFRNLGEASFRAVLDMLSGRFDTGTSRVPARLDWDRASGTVTARPSALMIATGNGGTIPDRGHFRVVLPDCRTRIGELDEEFVYESRPGDTFLLGSQVWRIRAIDDDRVVALPAPGAIPRMPFWRGDMPWRPFDLGKRVGAFTREVAGMVMGLDDEARTSLDVLVERQVEECRHHGAATGLAPAAAALVTRLARGSGLDRNGIRVVVDLLTRRLEAGDAALGTPGLGVATDRHVIAEIVNAAAGDVRLVVHAPFGGRVNGAWALALAGLVATQHGIEPQVTSNDDGLMMRLPETVATPPMAFVRGLVAAEVRARLVDALPGSATFVAQFRMNADRALLLPGNARGKRTAFWMTRLRAADLLQSVAAHPDFPLLHETVRDCLRDVLDVDGLVEVLDGIERGDIAVTEVSRLGLSTLGQSLDARLEMQYMYEGATPRSERALATLSLDTMLLDDLLRDGTLASLLAPEVVRATRDQRAGLAGGTRARDRAGLARLLVAAGDLDDAEIAARVAPGFGDGTPEAWLAELVASGDARRWRGRWIDASVAVEYAHLATNPGPVLARHVRHTGPVTVSSMATRYGLTEEVVEACLTASGEDLVRGQFGPNEPEAWASRGAVAQMHRQAILALRRQVRPVAPAAYAHFLAGWHGLLTVADGGGGKDAGSATAVDRLRRAIQQLRGLVLPVVTWRRDVIAPRIGHVTPTDPELLDLPGADIAWVVMSSERSGALAPNSGGRVRAMLSFRGELGLFAARNVDDAAPVALSAPARLALHALREEGALLASEVATSTGLDVPAARQSIVDLVRAGLVTHDTTAALVALAEGWLATGGERTFVTGRAVSGLQGLSRDNPMPRLSRAEMAAARRRAREVVATAAPITRSDGGSPSQASRTWAGRWSLVHRPSFLGRFPDAEDRHRRQARQLLARWGVVTRVSVTRDAPGLDWDAVEPVFANLEARGEVLRGYFVEGFPGVQYALPDAVERLREVAASRATARSGMASAAMVDAGLVVMASLDPAFWPVGDAELVASRNGLGDDEFEPVAGLDTSDDDDEAVDHDAGDGDGRGLRFARGAHLAVAMWWGDAVATMACDDDGRATLVTLNGCRQCGPAAAALAQWWQVRLPGRWVRLVVTRWNGQPVGGGAVATTRGGDQPDGAVIEPYGFVRDVGGYAWLGGRRNATK